MVEPVIRVDGLGKRYRIGARREPYRTLRDAITRAALAPVRRIRSFGRASHREQDSVWVLRDVSFEVQPGEVLGIIGCNGAGKTTLLKILSRITDPTEGRAVLRGRVGSLLEVGTGFHPELTGQENVYLSGAILGMKRAEIRAKFDEIVDFSGVERFIDTPVKRYSSGMRVRLGFAVAAHLEPEILLIDEVLAVGDAAFRKKCLGKMDDVARQGRTVLFVSHNLGAIAGLCPKTVLLHGGHIVRNGPSQEVANAYLTETLPDTDPVDAIKRPDQAVRLAKVECLDAGGTPCRTFLMGTAMRVRIAFEVARRVDFGILCIITNAAGQRVFAANTHSEGVGLPSTPGAYRVEMRLPRVLLNGGYYSVGARLLRQPSNTLESDLHYGTSVEILPADMVGAGELVRPWQGVCWMDHAWQCSGVVPRTNEKDQ